MESLINQMSALSLNAEPMEWLPTTPPPAAQAPTTPSAPRKREREYDFNHSAKRRRLDFDWCKAATGSNQKVCTKSP